jgi:hypothetical protein
MPTLVLVVVFSTVVFVALGISKGATARSMILYGLLMVAYLAYLAVWYPRRMRRRLFKCWETYDLEIGRDYLLRRQADIPVIRLQFDEVQAVEHVQGRYLRVIGQTKGRAIAIPEGIDHFDQVLETVSSLRPVRLRTIEQWQKVFIFMAAGLLLFMTMLWASSRRRIRYRWRSVRSSCGSSFGFDVIRIFRKAVNGSPGFTGCSSLCVA